MAIGLLTACCGPSLERLPATLQRANNTRQPILTSEQFHKGGAGGKDRRPSGHATKGRQPRREPYLLAHAVVLREHQIDMRQFLAEIELGLVAHFFGSSSMILSLVTWSSPALGK